MDIFSFSARTVNHKQNAFESTDITIIILRISFEDYSSSLSIIQCQLIILLIQGASKAFPTLNNLGVLKVENHYSK